MAQVTRDAEGRPDTSLGDPMPLNCKKCGEKLRRDNRSGSCYKCRAYDGLTPYSKQQNCERSRKNSAEFRVKIDAIKLERGCVDCGYNRYPEALDFDHLPRVVKTKNIALMWGCSWEKVLAEIAKCEIVCSNCHRHRTKLRTDADKEERAKVAAQTPALMPFQRPLLPCGTEAAYRRHLRRGEPPCAECKAVGVSAARSRRRKAGEPQAA